MAIQYFDMGRSMGNALATAGVYNQMQDRKQMRNFLAENGEALMSGDPAALGQYAQYDPGGALSMRNSMSAERRAQAAAGRQQREFDMRMAEYASNKTAAELAQERDAISTALRVASAATTPEEWDAGVMGLVQRGSIDEEVAQGLLGQFDKKDALIAEFTPMKDWLDQRAPKEKEYGFDPKTGQYWDKNNPQAGANLMPGFDAAPNSPLATFRLPDGTEVQVGGQNPLSTNTPRDGGKLAQKLSENDAVTLQEVTDAGRDAADLGSLGRQLETVAGKVGYTGPGGGFLGAVDDVVGFLPGDTGARGAFKSLAMEAQLSFTEKTKGAITDREMGMFREAVPNLGQRPDANKAISQVMQAGAKRVQTRAAFFENWARKHGSLEGAGEVWSEYMEANPIIRDNGDGIAVNPEGNWRDWLNRKPANSYSPDAIMQMSERDLVDVPVESMTEAQLSALETRWAQIKAAK